jgi:hypothetical protein
MRGREERALMRPVESEQSLCSTERRVGEDLVNNYFHIEGTGITTEAEQIQRWS